MAIPLERLEGKYEILEKLQEGGMGAIYKVRHRLLGEVRVVKVMRSHLQGHPDLETRFLAEARAATQLSHPHLAQVFDCTVDEDGVAYIVMEYIPGMTLEELLAGDEPLPLALALEIARQGLRAIGHLHKHKTAHRDISPDNLMLTRDVDGRPLVKLIDLGIAKGVEGGAPLTGAGVFLGKFRYAAPETFEEKKPADRRRGDLYSFALVLYELLTGTFPIAGDSPSSLIAGHLFRPPLDFTESDPEERVPENVRHAVLKALAKSPDERFADAKSFQEALATGAELDLRTPEIHRILKLADDENRERSGIAQPPGSTQSRLDLSFGTEPTPAPLQAGTAPAADPDATRILRPVPIASVEEPRSATDGDTETAMTSTKVQADHLVERARGLAAKEDFQRAGELLCAALSLEPDHAAARALLASVEACLEVHEEKTREPEEATEETTILRPHAAEADAGAEQLDKTVGTIRSLRDDGRAGDAFEELNRAVRQFGSQPVLQTLRHELGEALLKRDAEEEESRMFESPRQPRAAAEPMKTRPSIGPVSGVRTAPTAALVPKAPSGSLFDPTIRSEVLPAAPDRPGPPVARPNRSMVAVGLILAAVFALVVFVLTRQGPSVERDALEAEDVVPADLSPGALAIDAVPWAEIVSLENPEAEEDPPISPSRFTPVILRLPPGEYRITLRYPPTGQVEERVVRVESDVRVEQRFVFEELDGKQYFEKIGW